MALPGVEILHALDFLNLSPENDLMPSTITCSIAHTPTAIGKSLGGSLEFSILSQLL